MPDLTLDGLRRGIEERLARFRQTVPNAAPDNPAIAATARKAFQAIALAWDEADAAINSVVEQIGVIGMDVELTPIAKTNRAREAMGRAREKATAAIDRMSTQLEKLRTALEAALLPPCPAAKDAAAQEAAIAGIKVDTKMLLDGSTSIEATQELLEHIRSARAASDDLTVWVLAATSWPELYLKSRGIDTIEFRATLPYVLGEIAGDSPTRALASKLLDVLAGVDGLEACAQIVPAVVGMTLDNVQVNY